MQIVPSFKAGLVNIRPAKHFCPTNILEAVFLEI